MNAMSKHTPGPWMAFPDYSTSRENIIIGTRDGKYLGVVNAWNGYKYWPVRNADGVTVFHVRRELGGLYHPDAAKAASIQLAASILMGDA